MENKKCQYCGAEFASKGPRHKYCSRECGVKGLAQFKADSKANNNARRKTQILGLDAAARKARELGLSYGQAVALGLI